ncbi:hypothetical protein ABRY95_04750 [Castellaniella ginsengisoli]|uniref:Phage coat protein n=1 Tax=Castellaniella ginsengisoli TaxID=546114 RepID=A0AB39GTR2_9BURK
MFQRLKSAGSRALVAIGGVAAAPFAMAQATPPDFSTLTASIDFSTVIAGVMSVAAVMVGVYVAIKGAKIVLQMVRGA